MPQTKSRVVGSGFTTFNWRGNPIAFLDRISDSGQRPVAAGEPVMPIGATHAVEIATARAITPGTLTVAIRELWSAPVWWQLAGLTGTDTIIDVYNVLAADPSEVTCQMIIKPPGGTVRGKTYHNCVISDIDDSEDVTIATLTIQRAFTIMYTHITRFPVGSRAA